MLETLEEGVSVSEVARRHGVDVSQVFKWRRDAGLRSQPSSPEPVTFAPLLIGQKDAPLPSGLIELELAGGRARIPVTKLFADETRCPVLDPGRKRVKLGQLWAYARHDRPWGGGDPPAVVCCYAPGRGSEHAQSHLKGFSGILQVDGYSAYKDLASNRPPSAPLILSFCRVDGDVASPAPHRPGRADFPSR